MLRGAGCREGRGGRDPNEERWSGHDRAGGVEARLALRAGAERAVVVRHMIRNALIPVITILGPILAFLVTGSFIIEQFFGIPGIGRYYVQGIVQRDYSLIMAMTVIYAFAVAALNVVVDVLYGYIDPRIRYS